ncbi:MAG: 7-cyano-7-deazaguanine synthase QueC [Planctomycetes bacterium]|nr:7-cyano-7-deazaguanine synthase QueC [Planctomycetota bacterium]
MSKAIVLLSGGLDSTVALALALRKGISVKEAITFDYGQKSARREIDAARYFCRWSHIKHRAFNLKWLGRLADNPLTSHRKKIPQSVSLKASRAVWIPNRNGLFINIAAAIAEANGYKYIITGFNRDEAQHFPDNTMGFVRAINNALGYSTLKKVKVLSPTGRMTKRAIIRWGRRLKVPLERTWSCYDSGARTGEGGRKPCGVCASCRLRETTD